MAILWRRFFLKITRYKYPYVDFFRGLGKKTISKELFSTKKIIFILRTLLVFSLAIAASRPQIIDENSRVWIEGVDIIIVLDASGSMELFDDIKDRRSRFSVAKSEAQKFIKKRENDQIGLVIFGATAVSRSPLTLDKNLLHEIVSDTKIGEINPDGTVLSIALGMAVKRLVNSKAKSKVVILVTDGAPSPHDVHPAPILELAKKYNVKVYTIGVGSEKGGYTIGPFGNTIRCYTPINKELLNVIASQTGGEFFEAQNPEDVARIYETIDKLEATRYDAPSFTRYTELFMIFLFMALFFFASEVILTTLRISL